MIIGIAGVSRAGKTSMALQIQKWVGTTNCIILSQDDYIQDLAKMLKVRDHVDWEHPSSIDYTALLVAVQKAHISSKVVIVEGHLAFCHPEMNLLFDKRIFIHISKEAFLLRKTLDNRWEDEPDWYIEHIWNQHFVHGVIPLEMKDNVLQVDGEVGYVKKRVKTYLNL
ncbi:MAG: hypothetical protein B7C24_06190 [Bacteroidetes bacterium 4572_77]|nr:MAG: hypothetical protein B7C24_06190 [Bacteroidetes bacterium 4572_77]